MNKGKRSDANQNTSVTAYSLRRGSRISRGQSSVEFALISIFALVIMLVGIQYALLGQAAVALNKGASALARYAIENPEVLGGSTGNGTVTLNPGLENLLSSTIGTNGWGDLTVTIASYQGSSNTPVSGSPAFGDRCVISFTYNTQSKIALPNPFLALPPIFPGISFPGTLTASATQVYQ